MSAVIRLVTALLLVAAGVITGCTAPVTQPVRPWREVPAPAPGSRVLGFAWVGGELLATGSVPGPDGRTPAAWLGSAWHPIPLHPSTGYAKQAELVAPAVSGERLFMRGQAWGGAHGNPRPTLWTGGPSGLNEYPQRFELLGGERAMSAGGTAASSSVFVLTGQWDHVKGGPGAAVWVSADGVDWTQLEDEPSLLSGPGEQGRILGVASRTGGFTAVGDVLVGAGSVPMSWSSADGRSWRREPLASPRGGTQVSAERIGCDARGCVAVGVDTRYDGKGGGSQRLVCWADDGAPVSPDGSGVGAEQLLSVDGLAVDEDRVLVVTRAGGRPELHVLDRGCRGDTAPELPEAAEGIAVAAMPGGRVLLATSGGERSRLWTLAP